MTALLDFLEKNRANFKVSTSEHRTIMMRVTEKGNFEGGFVKLHVEPGGESVLCSLETYTASREIIYDLRVVSWVSNFIAERLGDVSRAAETRFMTLLKQRRIIEA